MDAWKVLKIKPIKIKGQADIQKLRERAKRLYKRYADEKDKFEAKKVMEAFNSLKIEFEQAHIQILGRSRKERELDKHYNHQSKELRTNKGVKKVLKREARGGDQGFRLPGAREGDKYRRKRRRGRHGRHRGRHHRSRRMKTKPKIAVDVLEGLQKLRPHLKNDTKFAKAVKLLYRWVKDYMNMDNREYAFVILQEAVSTKFAAEDPEGRQDVIMLYEYVLNYFEPWFEESDNNRMLAISWRIGAIFACRCFTDDSFTFTSVLARLTEMVKLFEEKRDLLQQEALRLERLALNLRNGQAGRGEVNDEIKYEIKGEVKEDPKGEFEEELKAKMKEELKAEFADNVKDEDVKSEDDEDEPFEFYDDMSSDEDGNGVFPNTPAVLQTPLLPSPSPQPDADENDKDQSAVKPETRGDKIRSHRKREMEVKTEACAIDLDDSDGDVGKPVELGSESSDAIDVGSEDDDAISLASNLSSDSDGVIEEVSLSDSDGSAEEGFVIFSTPSAGQSLFAARDHFVDSCLDAIFRNRHPLWAKSKVDAFFQEVYYQRELFSPEHQLRIEAWQARIKVLQKAQGHVIGEANNILEAHVPVVDSRETRTLMAADSDSWAAKQTFDARDRFGGSKTLR